MATTKKMTKKDMFTQILNTYHLTIDEQAFIEHELELLERKNSGEKKPSSLQKANASLKEAIYHEMKKDVLYTITDMVKKLPCCADYTPQKISALVNQMVPEQVERVEDKRKTYFRVIK